MFKDAWFGSGGVFQMRTLWIISVALAPAACAGRGAAPVATVQQQDAYSDCSMINAEIQANNKRAEELASEQNAKVVRNVAAGVVGIVVWPVWFAMDAKGAASTDAAALKAYLVNPRRAAVARSQRLPGRDWRADAPGPRSAVSSIWDAKLG
jgi:hypothetical protein